MVPDGACISDRLGLHEFLVDVRSGKASDSRVVFSHRHTDHADEIALEMTYNYF